MGIFLFYILVKLILKLKHINKQGRGKMKKIISFILGCFVALNLSISVANSAANEVRVAYFLEWPSPNLEDMMKKNYSKALGVPVKWTSFNTGVELSLIHI